MNAGTRTSRRTLIKTIVAGGITGGAWSSGLLWAADLRQPVVEVIGREESQIVLIDTGVERILIISGPYDETLANGLSDLMGSMRKRIDILLATESSLEAGATDIRSKWNVALVMALPELETVTSQQAEVTVVEPIYLTLSEDVRVRIIPHHRYTISSIGTDPGWRIEVHRGNQTLVIAPNLDVLSALPAEPYALAIAPLGSMILAQRKSVASAYALNDGAIDSTSISSIATRIYDSDVARFGVGESSIRLPNWTIQPEISVDS